MFRLIQITFLMLLAGNGFGQYNWKLKKDEQGIKVYAADVPGASYKAVKVECTLTGTYEKLIRILSDVPQSHTWIYHCKQSRVLKTNTPYDYIYYTETILPWPMSNRDVVIHMRFNTGSMPALLTITGTAIPGHEVKNTGLVRISQYQANWRVTMPGPQTLAISYELLLDPGGSLPAWMANNFVTKGPYETFLNLGKKLKE